MGCDIHVVLESRKVGSSEWIGQWCSDNVPMKRGPRVAYRDYGLFQRFGVRGRSESGPRILPRNLPEDVSRLAWTHYMRAPTDHHSASWCTPDEFVAMWFEEHPNSDDVRREHAVWDLLKIETDWPEATEHRLVFWFDN